MSSKVRAQAAPRTPTRLAPRVDPRVVSLVSLILPGVAHLWLGRRQKGVVFALALPLMFVIGLLLHGRLFPFTFSEPLVGLAAVAALSNGVPYLLAVTMGAGAGIVTAATYEYGNSFIIVAGLLNMLVALDAYDVALGRK